MMTRDLRGLLPIRNSRYGIPGFAAAMESRDVYTTLGSATDALSVMVFYVM